MSEKVFMGVYDLSEAKRFEKALAENGVEVEKRTNPQTCTRGCKVTVELWVEEAKLDLVRAFLQQEMSRDLMGHKVDLGALGQVFDASRESAICQACGTTFSSDLNECPDCGLFYG